MTTAGSVLTDDGHRLWRETTGRGDPVVLCHGGPRLWDMFAGPELVAACRGLPVPTLILEGAEDLRPRWAVDSLAAALPTITRVTLPGVGHLPWIEAPEPTLGALRDFLG